MATLSKKDAEETVNFMLPQIRKEIETIGKSSIRMQVLIDGWISGR